MDYLIRLRYTKKISLNRKREKSDVSLQNKVLEAVNKVFRKPWEEKVLKAINKAIRVYDLIEDCDHIALALSGGKDGRALAYLLRLASAQGDLHQGP